MKEHHEVSEIRFFEDTLLITIDGKQQAFPYREFSSLLCNASDTERNTYEISPAGYGIHWPLLDEDISIDGLLNIVHEPAHRTKSA